MDKKLFSDLVTSLKQAGQIAQAKRRPSRVYQISTSRVKAIRARTKLSQSEFALLMGVSVKTLQNWEQHRRNPTGPAAALPASVLRDAVVPSLPTRNSNRLHPVLEVAAISKDSISRFLHSTN